MTKVKVCGIRTVEAAVASENGGADFIGFIFFKKSRRYIEPLQAAKIADCVSNCKKVGVFVDEDIDTINSIADIVNLDFVQLHGHETANFVKKINRSIIKAWRFGDDFNFGEANNFPCDIILIDSFVKGQAGGTGQSFNWHEAVDDIAQLNKPVLIAGGISIENVNDVIAMFNPFGVDVSGSLEISGEKSIDRIRDFLKFVKGS